MQGVEEAGRRLARRPGAFASNRVELNTEHGYRQGSECER